MKYRIGINGYGRIGRCVLRALYESNYREQIEIVAMNELADIETVAHLTRFDTTHGRFSAAVRHSGETLFVNEDAIKILHYQDIEHLPWRDLNVDAVMECTGVYARRKDAETHLKNGGKKVVFSQPTDASMDATIVYGVNDHILTAAHKIISNASCTSNCIVPLLKTIDDDLAIQNGVITTIHSMMNDQPVIDGYHHHDLRRTRSAVHSIIPVKTELASGIGKLLPNLSNRFQSIAIRVPIINVSAMDVSILVKKETDSRSVNRIINSAAETRLKGILGYTEEPLASCDFNHDSRSCIVDGTQTRVSDGRLVKLFSWFDNEWAYANRMLDTTLALLKAA